MNFFSQNKIKLQFPRQSVTVIVLSVVKENKDY